MGGNELKTHQSRGRQAENDLASKLTGKTTREINATERDYGARIVLSLRIYA
jgi:hypothetical protein